jgi:hypothetical protein
MKTPPSFPSFPSVKNRLSRISRISWFNSFCALLSVCAGCQVLTYKSATGERFTRSSLGSNLAISSLSVTADTNGMRSVNLQGYQNDSTQALGAVSDAAVKAAIAAATKQRTILPGWEHA